MDDTPDWARSSQPVTTRESTNNDDTPAWAQSAPVQGSPKPSAGVPVQSAWDKVKHGQSDPDHPNVWNVVYGLNGAYQSAVMNGLMAEPVRAAMEGVGYGMPQLKAKYPNQTDAFYKAKLHDMYNQAITDSRTDAEKQVKDNPYPGHTVANFGAGVLGSVDPTWAINPTAGFTKLAAMRGVGGVAARVAASAAAHAELSEASDAAAQVMDIAEGQKKDFDIERNLTAAAFGGTFGGVAGGLGEVRVPKFVKDMFGKRGVDTLPSGDPRANTSPMTGDKVTMSPEDTANLRNLIRTGSVDDIKGFLADKQGPKPTWKDVNDLVQARDAIPENAVQRYKDAIDQHLTDTHKAVLEDHFENQMADWKNKPDVEVVHKAEDIADPTVRDNSIKAGLNDQNTVGFVGPDGKVRVFAGAIKTPEQASAVLFHEGLGHYGLAQKFGAGLDKTLDTLTARNVGQFGKAVDDWQKANPGAYNGNRTRAAEEVLAEMSQNGQVKSSISDALVSHVRRFGRQMGLKLSYSDAEINNILALSHDAVVNGTKGDVAANGFRGMATEESKSGWLSSHTDDMENPFVKGKGDLPDADVHQIISEGHEDARQYRPEGKHLPEEDVHQIMSESEPIPRWAQHTESHDFTKSEGHLDEGDVKQIVSEDSSNRFTTPERLRLSMENESYKKQERYQDDLKAHIKDVEKFLHENEKDVSNFQLLTKTNDANHGKGLGYGDLQDIYEKRWLQLEAKLKKGAPQMHPNDVGAVMNALHEPNAVDHYLDRQYEKLDQYTSKDSNKFMTPEQLAQHGKDVHEAAYEKFGEGYTPRYRSIEEAKEAARNTALDVSEFKGRDGVGNLDRKLFVYDNAAKEANAKLLALSEKAKTGPLDADDLIDLAKTTNDFHYVLGRLDNDLGQVGRALNAAKQIEFRRNNIIAMKKALEQEGSELGPLLDPETGEKFLRQFAALAQGGNPHGAAQMIKSVSKPYWWQYLLTWRNNMMLSGLSTHLKNQMDMATTAGREFEEKLATLPLSAVRGMARSIGMKVKPGVQPTEVALHAWGLARAVLDAQTYKDAAHAFGTAGLQRFGGTGIQNPRIPLVSKVSDLLHAEDTLFRGIINSAHLYALGGREAVNAGVKGFDNIMTAGAGHARNPTQAMLAEAKELTENTMLLNKSHLNDALDRAKRIKPGMNGAEQLGSFLINYVTPFIRVQSNALMNQLVRRSPVSFLDPVTRADWAAGGARRDVAIMRTVIGSAIMVNAWNAADPKNDKLTGDGPEGNVNKIKEMEASGWRAGSVHENGRYNQNSNLNLSLNPFDLHNNTATLVKGVREAVDQGMDKGKTALAFKLAATAIMHDLTSQTFVSDVGKSASAFDTKGERGAQKMERFAGDQVRTFLPNATNQAAKIIDPVARNTSDGIVDQVQSYIPGATKNLPARHNVYGEEQKTGTSVTGVHTWFSQGNGQDEVTDPAEKELARLGKGFKETLVSPVQRTITVKDTSQFDPDQINDAGHVKLTTKQFEEYQRMAGKEIVESMRDKMNEPGWADMSDEAKAEWVHKMQASKKKAVRNHLYGG